MKRLWDKRVLWFVRMEATARPSVPPAFDRFFTDPQCAQPLSPGCFEKLPMATKTQLDGETFLCKPAKSSLVIRRLQVPHAGIPSTRVLTRACPRVLSAQPCALTSPVRTRFVRLTLRCYASPLLPGHLEIALRRPEHEVRRPCPPRVKENAWSTHAAVTRVTPAVKS